MLLEEGFEATLDSCTTNCCKMEEDAANKQKQQQAQKAATATTAKIKRHNALDRCASFIRAHDLELTAEDLAKCSLSDNNADDDEQRTDAAGCTNKEMLSLATSSGGSGIIMSRLATIGISEAADESSRWVAVSATDRILKRRAKAIKKGQPIEEPGAVMGKWTNAACGKDVFVWSSKCTRPGHGADYPVVKSRGLVPASAKDMVELIKDSSRVKSYQKMSIGREDQAMLTQSDDANGCSPSVHCSESKCPQLGVVGEAKIMSSKSQPPLTRKPIEIKSLFYARQLTKDDGVEMGDGDDGGVAYVTVGRSVWETVEGTEGDSDGSSTRCEILLSVNLVREIVTEDGEQWCELTSVSHAVTQLVPIFVGKQLGLVAAETYIKDVRALFEKSSS